MKYFNIETGYEGLKGVHFSRGICLFVIGKAYKKKTDKSMCDELGGVYIYAWGQWEGDALLSVSAIGISET